MSKREGGIFHTGTVLATRGGRLVNSHSPIDLTRCIAGTRMTPRCSRLVEGSPMRFRIVVPSVGAGLVAAVAWLTHARPENAPLQHWDKVIDGVFRTKEAPHTYAVVTEKKAVLIDATVAPEKVKELGAAVEAVLL